MASVRRPLAVLLYTIAWLAALPLAHAGGSIGFKLWPAQLSSDQIGLAGDENWVQYGVSASADLSPRVFVSGSFLVGTIHADSEFGDEFDVDTKDGDALIGYSFGPVDVGGGMRITSTTQEGEETDNIYGPMAYVGVGGLKEGARVGGYVGASWMFKDLGDLEGEHVSAEGGIIIKLHDRLNVAAGPRVKYFHDDDLDLTVLGAAITTSITF